MNLIPCSSKLLIGLGKKDELIVELMPWLKLHSEIFETSMCPEEHETNGAHHKNK